MAKRVDGVIFTKAPGANAQNAADGAGRARGCPSSCSRGRFPDFAADIVEMDDKRAAHEGVTHLLRLGYRRIGFITGLGGATTSRRRLDGYRAALRDRQQPVDPALDCRRRLPRRIGLPGRPRAAEDRPDAVFISNYLMSVGFMEALRQYQLRCPEDVAIVTCDDHPWLDSFSPRLTTIDLPKHELGAAAARLLIERLSKGARAAAHHSTAQRDAHSRVVRMRAPWFGAAHHRRPTALAR